LTQLTHPTQVRFHKPKAHP